MKKIFILFIAMTSLSIAGIAQEGARQFVFFEHFTQASCGPCAVQNPVFQDGVMADNPGNIHHVAYHTSWPGVDPMNAANMEEVQTRVDYYTVSGVPDMYLNGTGIGGPGSATQAGVDAAQALTSAIRVNVGEEDNGDGTRTVMIDIESVLEPGVSSAILRTAVVEANIDYATPPGNNGETDFPNVFRQSLNGMEGETFDMAAVGEMASFEFTYTLDDTWEADEIYVIAWVQNDSDKSVINSGSSRDAGWEHLPSVDNFADASAGDATFLGSLVTGSTVETYQIELVLDQPGSWDAEIEVDGEIGQSLEIELAADSSFDINLLVSSDDTPAVGSYTVTVSTEEATQGAAYSVISNVTDMVITNTEGWGDPAYGEPIDAWAGYYMDGLEEAGSTTHAATDHFTFIRGMNAGALGAVNNIYFNVGWSFPSLTDDKVAAFEAFLDNGGNMLVAGQDIAWEASESTYFTPATQSFFENYMHAAYVSDGGVENVILAANEDDEIYGDLGESEIIDTYGTYYYPDVVTPLNGASGIFTYDGNSSGAAGVRAETDDYKMVYVCIGLEMMQEDVRTELMTTTYDYFYGSTVECGEPIVTGTDVVESTDGSDGSITIEVEGDASDYTFDWADSDVTGPSLEGVGAGEYEVTVTDADDCSETITVEVTGAAVDVQDLTVGSFAMWPNPMNDQLFIQMEQSVERMQVFNALGQQVFSLETPANNTEINTQEWSAGLYTIVFTNNTNQYTTKVVKK